MKIALIVDDETEVSMIFSKILAEQGYEIRHCGAAEEAIRQIQSGLSPSIVFLDIRLPGMDGIAALPKLLQLNSAMRIVMMTAYQTVESVVKAMKSGAVDYLVKPLSPQMVVQAVQKYGPSAEHPVGDEMKPAGFAAAFMAHTSSMKTVLSMAEKFASSDGTVLILGESGTGKELLAHYIHQKSARKNKPFVVVDCASIPEPLFESELFGYEKGAFTGADAAKVGRFELADGGTLFLDEIGNVPLTMQPKLLRFMEDRKLVRLGSKKSSHFDIRLVAATNADLKIGVQKGTFREDLYYRISALTVHLTPLRNRPKEEKEFLAQYFVGKNAQMLHKPQLAISEGVRHLLLDYPWPGNVREMQNALHSATLLCEGNTIEVSHLPLGIQSYLSHKEPVPENSDRSLREILDKVEREQIFSVLKQTEGNKKKASEILDMDYKSLLNKLKKYSQEGESS